MIDLKQLRDDPQRFKDGAAKKNIAVDIDRIVAIDAKRREALTRQEQLRAEQKRIEKESGPKIGQLAGAIKKAPDAEKTRLQGELDELKARPAALKAQVAAAEAEVAAIGPELDALLLQVPLPPDPDVPIGRDSSGNIEIRRWNPRGFDTARSFEANKGFKPRMHQELLRDLKLADFERGVKMAGSRSYVLTGDGMRLHHAVLRYALDFMAEKHGFTPVSVPVIVREEVMVGTGFFPAGREQAYHIPESARRNPDEMTPDKARSHDLFLTGTGEVGLMGLHMGEILEEARLPLKYVTVSTCFRREAGAAGKDTAGLFRIHQFDKVEQVVICRADEQESRRWHRQMIGYVEELLQSLGLPYRLLQCCTGDLGPKNADMVDIESWMPGRGEAGPDGRPAGAYGETHSASRLYDFQCRRLGMRYRTAKGESVFCHSLNNTVAASPRLLIPLLEVHQQSDGSVVLPDAIRPYMGGRQTISHGSNCG